MPTARFLGHSCVHISDGKHNLIIDPFISGNPKAAIKPEEVKVEIIAGQLSSHERIQSYTPVTANLITDNGSQDKGVYLFEGTVNCDISGRFGIKARVLPNSDLMPHTLKPKLISWW